MPADDSLPRLSVLEVRKQFCQLGGYNSGLFDVSINKLKPCKVSMKKSGRHRDSNSKLFAAPHQKNPSQEIWLWRHFDEKLRGFTVDSVLISYHCRRKIMCNLFHFFKLMYISLYVIVPGIYNQMLSLFHHTYYIITGPANFMSSCFDFQKTSTQFQKLILTYLLLFSSIQYLEILQRS